MRENDASVVDRLENRRLMASKQKRHFLGTKKAKFYLGGAIVLLALAALIYTSIQGSTVYYLSVSELQTKSETLAGQDVRVGAKVVPGSIEWDQANRTVTFEVVDEEGAKLPVTYVGLAPDAFKDDADVVIEGKYNPGRSFQAHTLLAKCPSKYIPAA